MMGYYLGVIILGQFGLGAGVGLIGSGLDVGYRADPSWGTVAIGSAIALAGALTVLAGFFGGIYKLIVDGIARGRGITV